MKKIQNSEKKGTYKRRNPILSPIAIKLRILENKTVKVYQGLNIVPNIGKLVYFGKGRQHTTSYILINKDNEVIMIIHPDDIKLIKDNNIFMSKSNEYIDPDQEIKDNLANLVNKNVKLCTKIKERIFCENGFLREGLGVYVFINETKNWNNPVISMLAIGQSIGLFYQIIKDIKGNVIYLKDNHETFLTYFQG